MSVQKIPGLYEMQPPSILRTSLSKDEITDKVLLAAAKHANLSAGDRIVVQCMDHLGHELRAEAEFRVVKRSDSIQVRDLDGYRTMQDQNVHREICQIGEWWISPVTTTPEVVWNPGKKMHQVKVNGEVVFETADKDEAKQVAEGKRAA